MVKAEFAHAASDVFGGVTVIGGHQLAQSFQEEVPVNQDSDLLVAHAGTLFCVPEMKMPQGFCTLSGWVSGPSAKGHGAV